jgi:hypothetical protein
MKVDKAESDYREIIITNAISKLSTPSLFSKNKSRVLLMFKKEYQHYTIEKFLLQTNIITTQIYIKRDKTPHKLHSLHRSYNKV